MLKREMNEPVCLKGESPTENKSETYGKWSKKKIPHLYALATGTAMPTAAIQVVEAPASSLPTIPLSVDALLDFDPITTDKTIPLQPTLAKSVDELLELLPDTTNTTNTTDTTPPLEPEKSQFQYDTTSLLQQMPDVPTHPLEGDFARLFAQDTQKTLESNPTSKKNLAL